MALTLTSPAFEHGQPSPWRYACEGDDISPPFGHAVRRAGRALSWPSPARAAASVPPATAAGCHRQLPISSTAPLPRCPCGSG